MMTTPTVPSIPEGKASIRYLYLITLVAAVGGFLLGYDLSLISGAIIFLKAEWNLSPFWMGAGAGGTPSPRACRINSRPNSGLVRNGTAGGTPAAARRSRSCAQLAGK